MSSTLVEDETRPAGPLPALDGYRLDREIGRGGLGRVFLAWDLKLERPVALKELLSDDALALARFEREARITARLQHPGIIPIYAAGRATDGAPFYAMRFVEGQTLEARIHAAPTLEARLQLLPFVLAAVDAVAYAHNQGVVHRDLKPANVLCGAFGETVVIDWGIASDRGEAAVAGPSSARDPTLTWTGSVSGTPGYMSPEQERGLPADPRSDVFSLGATLYHVVAGRRPRGSARVTTVAEGAVRKRGPVEALTGVPPDLAALIARAMHDDPQHRYPQASALADDLRQWLAGRSVSAFDYSPWALVQRWVRRHVAAVTVAMIGLLGAGLSAALGVSGMARERRVATERSWQLTMLQARSALTTDPTATIGWLLTLPASYEPAQARALAAAAVDLGVSQQVLRGHDGSVSGLCFAHGALLSVDLRRLFRWNLATGQPTLEVKVGDESQRMVCSPDGEWAAWDESSSISLLHVSEGVVRRLVGHAGLVGTLAFDGEQLFSTSSDGTLRRWRLADGQGEVLFTDDVALGALAIDPTRHVLATGDARGGVHFFDTQSGRALRRVSGNQGQVTSMGFTASGALVTAGVEGAVHVFEPSGALRVLVAGRGPIDVAVGREHVVTWGQDLPVVLYDLAGASTQLRESGEAPAEAVVSGDDQWVAFSDAKGVHVRHANEPERLFKGHSVPARSLAFSPDGAWLASTGHDSQVRVWALAPTGDRELLNVRGPAGPLAFSGDGGVLLSGSGRGEVALVQVSAVGARQLPRLDGAVHAVDLGPDERFAAAAGTDVRVLLFDRMTDTTQWLRGPTARVSSLQFGEGWLAAGADDGVHVWSLTPPFAGRRVTADTTTQVATSPDGRSLAAKTFAGDVIVWSMPEVVERRRFHHPEYAQAMAWAPDSSAIATGSWDKQVRVWPVDGSPPRLLGAGQGRVRRVAWDPRGQFVVSATNLGELTIWGLDGSRAVGVGHHDVIRTLAITPDGSRAVTSCFDGSIGVWRLPSGELAAWHEQLPSTDYLAIAHDGQSVAVGSQDGRVVLWRLAAERELPSGAEALRRRLAELTSARVEVATGVLATPRQP